MVILKQVDEIEGIKLTKDNVQVREVPTKGHALEPNLYHIRIDCNYDEKEAEELQKQILKNQQEAAYWRKFIRGYPINEILTIKQFQELHSKLTKEIAYAKYKCEKYADIKGYEALESQWSYYLNSLQMIEGTYSHEASYDEEFEKQYNKSDDVVLQIAKSKDKLS